MPTKKDVYSKDKNKYLSELNHAIVSNNHDTVRSLLSLYPSLPYRLSDQSFNILETAAAISDVEMLEIILDKKREKGEENVDVVCSIRDKTSKYRSEKKSITPFLSACQAGKVQNAAFLENNGADVNYQNTDGHTALHYAIAYKNDEVLNYLLDDAKVDVNIADNKGRTALHQAYLQGDDELIRRLIDKGAKLDAKDKLGYVPERYAPEKFNDDEDLQQFLEEFDRDFERLQFEKLKEDLAQELPKNLESASKIMGSTFNKNEWTVNIKKYGDNVVSEPLDSKEAALALANIIQANKKSFRKYKPDVRQSSSTQQWRVFVPMEAFSKRAIKREREHMEFMEKEQERSNINAFSNHSVFWIEERKSAKEFMELKFNNTVWTGNLNVYNDDRVVSGPLDSEKAAQALAKKIQDEENSFVGESTVTTTKSPSTDKWHVSVPIAAINAAIKAEEELIESATKNMKSKFQNNEWTVNIKKYGENVVSESLGSPEAAQALADKIQDEEKSFPKFAVTPLQSTSTLQWRVFVPLKAFKESNRFDDLPKKGSVDTNDPQERPFSKNDTQVVSGPLDSQDATAELNLGKSELVKDHAKGVNNNTQPGKVGVGTGNSEDRAFSRNDTQVVSQPLVSQDATVEQKLGKSQLAKDHAEKVSKNTQPPPQKQSNLFSRLKSLIQSLIQKMKSGPLKRRLKFPNLRKRLKQLFSRSQESPAEQSQTNKSFTSYYDNKITAKKPVQGKTKIVDTQNSTERKFTKKRR